MIEKKELTKEQAKEKALRLLEFRSHSEKELFDKLIRAGAKKDDIPEIMNFLKEYGFIDDFKYATCLAHDLQKIKRLGKRRIKEELRQKGIRGEMLEEVLSELPEEDGEELLFLAEKKIAGNFEKKNIERAIRYFAYRGYNFDDIKSCIEKLEAQYSAD